MSSGKSMMHLRTLRTFLCQKGHSGTGLKFLKCLRVIMTSPDESHRRGKQLADVTAVE